MKRSSTKFFPISPPNRKTSSSSTPTSQPFRVQPNRFLTFFSSKGSICEQVCLPFSSLFLHTCYFRLHQGEQVDEQDKKFAQVAWEVLNILKENFPSKVYLHQENLELCANAKNLDYMLMSQQEELRRQTSCLLSIKDEGRPLTLDELEDAWHTLTFAERISDVKAQNVCLELLNQMVPASFWQQLRALDLDSITRIMERADAGQLSSNRFLASEILAKIQQGQSKDEGNQTLQRQLNDISQNDDELISNESRMEFTGTSTIERPTSTRMCLFQLSESNDLSRVTLILETLGGKPKESLQQLRKKQNLSQKTVQIVKKYCNGDYGFDSPHARNGLFQRNLLNLLIILSQDYVVFLEYLQSQAMEFLCQILEEGVIFAYEDSMQGTSSLSNQALLGFLVAALDFIDLAVSKQFLEYVPQIKQMLLMIQVRLSKMLTKKENALLTFFIKQYSQETVTEKDPEQDGESGSLDVEQLNQLKALSPGLYWFAEKLNAQIQRIEALQEFNEKYEEKHTRLFYHLLGIQNLQESGVPKFHMEVVSDSKLGSYEEEPRRSKVQFKSNEAHTTEDRFYQQKEKAEYQSEAEKYQEWLEKIEKKRKHKALEGRYLSNKENAGPVRGKHSPIHVQESPKHLEQYNNLYKRMAHH